MIALRNIDCLVNILIKDASHQIFIPKLSFNDTKTVIYHHSHIQSIIRYIQQQEVPHLGMKSGEVRTAQNGMPYWNSTEYMR